MRKHFILGIGVLFSFVASCIYSQPTVEQVLNGLENREKSIHDLKVMYQFVRARTVQDQEEMTKNPDLAGKGYYYFSKHLDLFAMSPEKYVYEQVVSSIGSRFQGGLDHWHFIRMVNLIDSTGGAWEPSYNIYRISGAAIPFNIKLNFITTSPYVNGQLFQIYWPLSQYLRNFKKVSIGKMEKIDGKNCVEVTFSNNTNKKMSSRANINYRYWIDWKEGYTPVRSQRLINDQITAQHDYRDLQDYGNNVWLPMRIEFQSSLGSSQTGRPRTSTLQVIKMAVNENPQPGWLNFVPPRGCLTLENNQWPPKDEDTISSETTATEIKRGERLTRDEEATYFQRLFGISYPEVIAMFDKIQY